jgi:hypothetical protein
MRDDTLESFVPDVGRAIVPPDFDDIVRGARRRRRVGLGAAIGGTVAVVAVIIGTVQLVVPHHRGSTSPATSTTPDQSTHPTEQTVTPPRQEPDWRRLAPAQVIADPKAYLAQVAVSTTDPDRAAAIWSRVFVSDGWDNWAAVVTDDGWKTWHVATPDEDSKDDYLTSLADGSIVLETGHDKLWMLGDDLAWHQLGLTRGSGPLAPDEALASDLVWGRSPAAVNPSTMTARLLPTQPWSNIFQLPNGVLAEGGSTTRYSSDGGRTWRDGEGGEAVNTLDPNVLAVIRSSCEGDNCPSPLAVSADAGKTWTTREVSFGGLAVLTSNGTLIVANGQGLYTAPNDSGDLQPVHIPGVDGGLDLRGISRDGGTETVTACNASGCWTSTDDGHSWTGSLSMR